MRWSTPVNCKQAAFHIDHQNRILLLGSCFSQNMEQHLQAGGFQAQQWFGPLFNPISVLQGLQLLASGTLPEASELFQENGIWHSYRFHSSFSNPDASKALDSMCQCVSNGHQWFKQCDTIIISLGTSFVYRLKSSGQVVANCHKTPPDRFNRQRLNVAETVEALKQIETLCEGKRIIYTISPIRHLADGLHQNQLSKAILHLAVDHIITQSGCGYYFPAYEILLDELRDYRFYGEDLTHPSPLAVRYIYEQFLNCFANKSTQEKASLCEKEYRQSRHIPFYQEKDDDKQ